MRKNAKYGWTPDLPDFRDHLMRLDFPHGPLPPAVDLRPKAAAVLDQGDLGSCTSQAIAAAIDFEVKKQGKVPIIPSRLLIYYMERAMEGTISIDSGAQIRDGIKAVSKFGVAPETMWPYKIGMFAVRPPAAVYAAATKHLIESYSSVPGNLQSMKSCLALGYPFVFGFSVYESFESDAVAKTGIVPMPGADEGMLGGHAVLAVGYDDAKERFVVQNSWGTSWGQAGFFEMPYQYLSNNNLADDMWSIRLVED